MGGMTAKTYRCTRSGRQVNCCGRVFGTHRLNIASAIAGTVRERWLAKSFYLRVPVLATACSRTEDLSQPRTRDVSRCRAAVLPGSTQVDGGR
jgi:hypothetical protein